MTIVEFLTARLDEREQLARAVQHAVGTQYDALMAAIGKTHELSMVSLYWRSFDPVTVLAEVKAKRRLLAQAGEMREVASDAEAWFLNDYADRIEQNLAAPYADHPDYELKWAVAA